MSTTWLSQLTTSNSLRQTYISGFLDISAGDFINRTGNIYLHKGDISANSSTSRLFLGGDASLNGRLFVANDVSLNGNLSVGNTTSSVSFYATSDYRIKHNIEPLNNTFNVDKLKPVSYTNILLNKPDVGFLAHEVQEIFSFMVNGVKDGEQTQSINYNSIIGILVKEIQDLKKQMALLNSRINEANIP